jgi:hypothetical protein
VLRCLEGRRDRLASGHWKAKDVDHPSALEQQGFVDAPPWVCSSSRMPA